MRKRGLCCRRVSVRPSVCLSVTLVYCIQSAEDIVKLCSRPSSPIILGFSTTSADTKFPREPLQWERKIHSGWEKFAVFNGNRRLSRNGMR